MVNIKLILKLSLDWVLYLKNQASQVLSFEIASIQSDNATNGLAGFKDDWQRNREEPECVRLSLTVSVRKRECLCACVRAGECARERET